VTNLIYITIEIMFKLLIFICLIANAKSIDIITVPAYVGPVHYHTVYRYQKYKDPDTVLKQYDGTFCPPEYETVNPFLKQEACNDARSSITCWHHFAWCKHIKAD
jgi:hypothetical protein